MKNPLLPLCLLLTLFTTSPAQPSIRLNPPDLTAGKTLMQCLQQRKTSRAFSDRELSLQELSNLLWAANGINRPQEGKRTAPSAMNRQELDIYVILKTGVYLYQAGENVLLPVAEGDHRKTAGSQDFVATAPVNLILVSDLARMKGDQKMQAKYSGINAGYISQNIYLYCASAGLATVARGMLDQEALARTLKLKEGQAVILGQTVGWPK